MFFKIIEETPILNRPDFECVFGGNNQQNLLEDEKGHIRAIEFVALKNMFFKIIKKSLFPNIYEVTSCFNYKTQKSLFLDSRCAIKTKMQQETFYKLKPKKIIKNLCSLLGYPYIWGGNWSRGVDFFYNLYPSKGCKNKKLLEKWQLKGVDCSGFLFEATGGFTPRNTSELLFYKNPVLIENLTIDQIIKATKPLDIIVYKGHCIIILNSQSTIEAREFLGVVKIPIKKRLLELHATKKPKNSYKDEDNYVIRRWL